MRCPNCERIQSDENNECSGCGLIFAKWKEARTVVGSPPQIKGKNYFPLIGPAVLLFCCLVLVALPSKQSPPKGATAVQRQAPEKFAKETAFNRQRTRSEIQEGFHSTDEAVGMMMLDHVSEICIRNMTADNKSEDEIRARCLYDSAAQARLDAAKNP